MLALHLIVEFMQQKVECNSTVSYLGHQYLLRLSLLVQDRAVFGSRNGTFKQLCSYFFVYDTVIVMFVMIVFVSDLKE